MTVLAALFAAAALAAPSDEPCPAPVDDASRREALVLFRAGADGLEANDWEEAEGRFAAALRIDPLLPLAHYGRGRAAMGLKRYPEAVAAFAASRQLFRCRARLPGEERPADEKRQAEEVRELRNAIRESEGRRLLEGMIQWREVNRDPPPPQGQELRRVQEMEKRLWELEGRGRDDAPIGVTLALGTAYFHSGYLADAEREFRAVLAADPRVGDAHNNLAVVLMLTDRLEEAGREADLAEKAGVAVSPRLREEIRKRKGASAP